MLDLEFNDIKSKKTAVALGIFDGVHLGHQAVIKAAVSEEESGLLPTVFTFKSETVTTKGAQGALFTDEMKLERIERLGIRAFYSPDFSELCAMPPKEFFDAVLQKKLNAAAICCGENFRFGKDASGDVSFLADECRKSGIKLTLQPPVSLNGKIISSTRIKECLKEGNVPEALKMLGEPISYTLPVIHGRELGRTLDFPTINQALPKGIFLPRFGVYLSRVEVKGKSYRGVTNLGVKPTVGGNAPLIETNILGLDENLYGETASVSLLRFIRDEKKFNSLDELKKQVVSDIDNAKKGSF